MHVHVLERTSFSSPNPALEDDSRRASKHCRVDGFDVDADNEVSSSSPTTAVIAHILYMQLLPSDMLLASEPIASGSGHTGTAATQIDPTAQRT
jgi:hypothetical protein